VTSGPDDLGSFPGRAWWEDDPADTNQADTNLADTDPVDAEFPRRRRPRAVRWLALLLAVSLAAAAIGTGIEVLLEGDGSSAVTATVRTVGQGSTAGHELVTIDLVGPTSGPVTCALDVRHLGSPVGAGDVTVPTLRRGITRVRVLVPVTGPTAGSDSARVACRA
jgi:hypothetical protein